MATREHPYSGGYDPATTNNGIAFLDKYTRIIRRMSIYDIHIHHHNRCDLEPEHYPHAAERLVTFYKSYFEKCYIFGMEKQPRKIANPDVVEFATCLEGVIRRMHPHIHIVHTCPKKLRTFFHSRVKHNKGDSMAKRYTANKRASMTVEIASPEKMKLIKKTFMKNRYSSTGKKSKTFHVDAWEAVLIAYYTLLHDTELIEESTATCVSMKPTEEPREVCMENVQLLPWPPVAVTQTPAKNPRELCLKNIPLRSVKKQRIS